MLLLVTGGTYEKEFIDQTNFDMTAHIITDPISIPALEFTYMYMHKKLHRKTASARPAKVNPNFMCNQDTFNFFFNDNKNLTKVSKDFQHEVSSGITRQ